MRAGNPARAEALRVFLRGLGRSLGWQRSLVVLLLCVVFSTQVLAQPSIFGHWTLGQAFEGWLYYLAEIVPVGVGMLVAFALAENSTQDGPVRTIAVCMALPAGAAIGYTLALETLYEEGFRPTSLQFAGDTLRFTMMGAGVAFIDVMRRRAESAARRSHESVLSRAEIDKQVIEARLRLMEAQIEPHFLFNTLANVQRLFETVPESGRRLLANLREYLGAALPQMRESRSTLGREAQLVGAYLAILQARMGDRLQFSIDVPAAIGAHPFPPMMLITLVENGIKHGLHPSPHGGWIRIRARADETHVTIEVADSGVGFPKSAAGKGIGLSNVRARLAALFGRNARFSIAEGEPCGVVASISVPLSG